MNKMAILVEMIRDGEAEFYVTADASDRMIKDQTEDALEAIAYWLQDYEDLDDYYPEVEADVYTGDLLRWFAEDDYAFRWCEEAISSLGWNGVGGTMLGAISCGQHEQKLHIHYRVVEELQELAEDIPEYVTECLGGDICPLAICNQRSGLCPFNEEYDSWRAALSTKRR